MNNAQFVKLNLMKS